MIIDLELSLRLPAYAKVVSTHKPILQNVNVNRLTRLCHHHLLRSSRRTESLRRIAFRVYFLIYHFPTKLFAWPQMLLIRISTVRRDTILGKETMSLTTWPRKASLKTWITSLWALQNSKSLKVCLYYMSGLLCAQHRSEQESYESLVPKLVS